MSNNQKVCFKNWLIRIGVRGLSPKGCDLNFIRNHKKVSNDGFDKTYRQTVIQNHVSFLKYLSMIVFYYSQVERNKYFLSIVYKM